MTDRKHPINLEELDQKTLLVVAIYFRDQAESLLEWKESCLDEIDHLKEENLVKRRQLEAAYDKVQELGRELDLAKGAHTTDSLSEIAKLQSRLVNANTELREQREQVRSLNKELDSLRDRTAFGGYSENDPTGS